MGVGLGLFCLRFSTSWREFRRRSSRRSSGFFEGLLLAWIFLRRSVTLRSDDYACAYAERCKGEAAKEGTDIDDVLIERAAAVEVDDDANGGAVLCLGRVEVEGDAALGADDEGCAR